MLRQRKKKLEKMHDAKIDSYFKPAPKPGTSSKPKSAIKRQCENDENTNYNDENRKKVFTASSSQRIKRQFGEIKGGLQPKNNKNDFRLPLADKTPKNSLNISNDNHLTSRMTKSKRNTTPPGFAVLCDEDIEKGIEKAPTPPIRDSQEDYIESIDSQVCNSQAIDSQISNSQQDIDSQVTGDSQNKPLNLELNTQFIENGGDLNTQWTEVTSSPIDIYKDVVTETQDPALFILKDDGEPALDENYQPQKDQLDMENQLDKENLLDLSKKLPSEKDLLKHSSISNTENNNDKQKVKNNDNEEEEEEENDDDYGDWSLDSDLYEVANTNRTVEFRPVHLPDNFTKSIATDDSLFSDNESENLAPFFDSDSQEEDHFVEPDVEFSVNDLETPTEEAIKESLASYTLSQEHATTPSQIHEPLPNPRGKDILEKLEEKDEKN
jgi:hypothetical protein